jgi:mRNA deadenylase 3'-5' endonuclease subunit Ccr4
VVAGTELASAPQRLVTISWNILSQVWLEKSNDDYKHCTAEQTSWQNRVAGVLQWIKNVDPDLVMLQEVDYNVFDVDVLAPLRAAGYEGIIQKPKKVSAEQPCGCATLWRTNKLTLIPDSIKHCSRALVVGLKGASSEQLAAVNVHLESKQDSRDARARQLNSALEFAKTISRDALVVGGDFNTGADSSLLRTLREESWHGYSLASAYEHPAALATTAATLCTVVFPHIRYMIDHLLYSPLTLQLHALWQCVTPKEFASGIGHLPNGLPDSLLPSDHIPIGAIFEFVGGGERSAEQKEELSEEDKAVLRTKWKELMALAPARGKGKPSEQELLVLREHSTALKEFKAALSSTQLLFIQKEEKVKK